MAARSILQAPPPGDQAADLSFHGKGISHLSMDQDCGYSACGTWASVGRGSDSNAGEEMVTYLLGQHRFSPHSVAVPIPARSYP